MQQSYIDKIVKLKLPASAFCILITLSDESLSNTQLAQKTELDESQIAKGIKLLKSIDLIVVDHQISNIKYYKLNDNVDTNNSNHIRNSYSTRCRRKQK